MTISLPSDIADIVARQAMWDCELSYARGVDRLDEALIRSAFWDDAYIAHGPVNGTVGEFLAYWLPTQPAREASQHALFNHTVWRDGDVADTETYFRAYGKNEGSERMDVVGGRYLDRLERRGEVWRIANRLVVADVHCIADASEMHTKLSRSHAGSRSDTDPSYRRPARS